MNDFEAAARGQRATQAKEFIDPILADIRGQYMERIAQVASTELDPRVRTDKLTALSVALRILNAMREGVDAVIEDGRMAEKNIIKVENIERMGTHKRRLFDIAPSR
jgi:hypothetical protein